MHRERTGEATKVDIALFDCQLALLENAIMRYTARARSPARWARAIRRSRRSRPSRRATAHIIIAAGNDGLFVKTGEALGRPDLAENPLFKTNALRNQHQQGAEGRDRERC